MGLCHDTLQALILPADGSLVTFQVENADVDGQSANTDMGKNKEVSTVDIDSKRSRAGIVIKVAKERLLKTGVIKHLIAVAQRFADPQMQFQQRCEF